MSAGWWQCFSDQASSGRRIVYFLVGCVRPQDCLNIRVEVIPAEIICRPDRLGRSASNGTEFNLPQLLNSSCKCQYRIRVYGFGLRLQCPSRYLLMEKVTQCYLAYWLECYCAEG